MVPVPVLSRIVALTASLSVTVNVSSLSSFVSSTTGTNIVLVRLPTENVSFPLVVV